MVKKVAILQLREDVDDNIPLMFNKAFQPIFAYVVIFGTIAIVIYFVYYVIQCAKEKNLRM